MSKSNEGSTLEDQETVQNEVSSISESEDKEMVNYESHKKLLNQHKRNQSKLKDYEEELNKFRQAEQSKKEKQLEEQGEYTKILETYKQENARLQETIEAEKNERVKRSKAKAFISALPGELYNDDYLSLANLDNIVVDPQTGELDPLTVREVADTFIKEKPELIRKKASDQATSPTTTRQASQPVTLNSLGSNKPMTPLEQFVALRKSQENK